MAKNRGIIEEVNLMKQNRNTFHLTADSYCMKTLEKLLNRLKIWTQLMRILKRTIIN